MVNARFSVVAMLFLLVMASCGGQKKDSQQEMNETYIPQGPQQHRMDNYDMQDAVQCGSHQYVYTLHREASDSVGVVRDELGDEWTDNFYLLTIQRDGAHFFCHRFTKKDFANLLDGGFRQNGIFDGFRFSHADGGNLIFCVCVSYPESDMSAPFILTIAPDGSYSFQVDNVMDVEELGDVSSM